MKNYQWIITTMIALIVVFYIVSGLIPTAMDAGDDLGTDSSGSCTAVGCYWNESGTDQCVNVSVAPSGDCAETIPDMPLSSIFASGGLVFLLIGIAVLLFVFAKIKLEKKQ